MDTVVTIIKQFLGALLSLFELFVNFAIAALTLILDFARSIIGLIT
jgi:hypothetical protein